MKDKVKNIDKKKWSKASMIFMGSSVVLFLFFMIILALVVLMMDYSKRAVQAEGKIKTTIKVQYLQYDRETDISYVGFAHIGDETLNLKGYHSYEENDGEKLVLMSKVGSIQYLADGTCKCNNEVKDVKVLLAADSDHEANTFSNRDVREACEKEFSSLSSCNSETITYDLDDVQVMPIFGRGDFASFFCEGQCIQNTLSFEKKAVRAKAKEKDCSQFSKKGGVEIFFGRKTTKILMNDAKEKFVVEELHEFCKGVGKFTSKENAETMDGRKYKLTREVYLCYDGGLMNPTVSCVRKDHQKPKKQ